MGKYIYKVQINNACLMSLAKAVNAKNHFESLKVKNDSMVKIFCELSFLIPFYF